MRAALLGLLLALAACKTVPKTASDAGAPLFERSDVERRLRKWAPVKLEVDLSTLGEGERRALRALRRAADAVDRAYWRQIDPAAPTAVFSL